jgi:threonine dehydrogenase-like Zn-dependent dehydrogenase
MAMYKALTLRFSRTYTVEEFAAVLQMIGDGSLNVDPLVTDTIGLDSVPGAFEALATPGAQAKVLIDPSR